MKNPIDIIILGAGNRGHAYATYALRHPEEVRVVAVAEPRADYRNALSGAHGLPGASVFFFLARGRRARKVRRRRGGCDA